MTKVVEMEAPLGTSFDVTAWDAKQTAIEQDAVVRFVFNGREVNVDASTNLEALHRDYNNSWVLGRKVIGPNCAESLTEAEAQELAEANRVADEKERVRQAAYVEAQRQKTAALDAQIFGISIALKPGVEAEYAAYVEKNSKDGYSRGVVDYADRWARLMQAKLQQGAQLRDVAEATSHEADIDGITGFMYGCAVSALAHFWIHGDELRVWHNGQYGVSADAKGTVNPAVLTLSAA